MIYFDIETRQFADKNKFSNEAGDKELKQIGKLTFTFPTRKYKLTRKGKKRHQMVGIVVPIYGGAQGGMNKRAAIASMKSELKNVGDNKFILKPALLKKLMTILTQGK